MAEPIILESMDDPGTARPGDLVTLRLTVRNLSDAMLLVRVNASTQPATDYWVQPGPVDNSGISIFGNDYQIFTVGFTMPDRDVVLSVPVSYWYEPDFTGGSWRSIGTFQRTIRKEGGAPLQSLDVVGLAYA